VRGVGRLEGVELRRLMLPLAAPWRTALGTVTARDVLLVRAVFAAGEGWGECVAMGQPIYSQEYVHGAADVLRRHLLPLLLATPPPAADAVAATLAGVKGHPMAKAALEAAWLDAEGRAAGESLARRLGGTRSRVAAGVAVGVTGSIPELLGEVGRRLAEGYARVKLKIHPGWDVEPIGAVRERFGGDLLLQADANGSYRAERAGAAGRAALARLDPFDLLLIEQPLADDDLIGHAQLAKEIATPVCLDESITSFGTAESALALGACQVVNIKPGRVGGLLEAVRIHDLCLTRGVPVWCGGMLETGVGRAANLALASLPNFSLPGDLSPSGRWYREDITTPVTLDPDGTIMVPQGPGTGVEIRTDVLDALTASTEWWAAS
jgi:o-succinylbenzoate synthase